MPTLVIHEEPPDWEERYRLLFERHELFIQKMCMVLEVPFHVTSENDILELLGKRQESEAVPSQIRNKT